MAASATAAAAAPPLLPTPPNCSLPGLLPTPPSIYRLVPIPPPSIRPFAPSPASIAPSICSQKPGRASASESWIRDKAARAGLAPPSSMERTSGGKTSGRASLRDSWVKEKTSGRASLSDSWVKEKLASTKDTPPTNNRCGKRTFTPSSDSFAGKKIRYESPPALSEGSDSDSEVEFYAGPSFRNALPPSALPIPSFARHRAR